MESGDFISVVAEVNLTERTGQILYVNPVSHALTPESSGAAGFELRVLDAAGQTLGAYPAHVKLNSCNDPSEERTGIVDAVIPAHEGARRLELLFEGQVLDTFNAGGGVSPEGSTRRGGVAESAEAAPSNVTYNVQVSTDDGQTWQTLSVGRTSPDVTIDRTQFAPGSRVNVRVVATDGFTNTVADGETFTVE
ncbi:MAG: hypothetical protein ACJ754_08025 [Pyrinomonadaceae bacterium]